MNIYIDREALRTALLTDKVNNFWSRFTDDEWTDVLAVIVEHTEDLDNELDLVDAYDDGFRDGHAEGLDEGDFDGYDRGYADGYASGLVEGTERAQEDAG